MKSYIRIRIEIKIQELIYTQIGAVESRPQWRLGRSKWSPGGSVDQWLQICITLKNEKWIRIRIRIWIRISIKVMRIRDVNSNSNSTVQ